MNTDALASALVRISDEIERFCAEHAQEFEEWRKKNDNSGEGGTVVVADHATGERLAQRRPAPVCAHRGAVCTGCGGDRGVR